MILDFNFKQAMRLSTIKRWGIVEMSRSQSVAEHSYNVAIITNALCDLIPGIYLEASLYWALCHDLTEVVTGDIPTPLKDANKVSFEAMESVMFPEFSELKGKMRADHPLEADIVKLADYIDAIQFAQKFCVDSRSRAIIAEMTSRMYSIVDKYLECDWFDDVIGNVESWLDLKTD